MARREIAVAEIDDQRFRKAFRKIAKEQIIAVLDLDHAVAPPPGPVLTAETLRAAHIVTMSRPDIGPIWFVNRPREAQEAREWLRERWGTPTMPAGVWREDMVIQEWSLAPATTPTIHWWQSCPGIWVQTGFESAWNLESCS